MEGLSFSNTLSKGSVYESDSIYAAYLEDVASQLAEGAAPVAISNEEIHKGDEILETYRVEDDTIHGGMGSVWRVHHESWNADLAMKRPQPRFFAEGSERRKAEFIAECEHWINLGLHPNIVSCYYVRDIGGVPTIFSEWMDGGSLKDAIQSRRLYEGTEEEAQERILDIAIQVARGLQYAHEQGLIHQDVKPGNILLTRDWEAKVADFGLAKAQSQLTDGEGPASSGFTLQYCPGEQAEGATAEKWMDAFAWALTVMEMYAGRRIWATGAEAEDHPGALLEACLVPEALRGLLEDCLRGRRAFEGEDGALSSLERAYCQIFGMSYPRTLPEGFSVTAGYLNNRGLSFLDLGMEQAAQQCLAEAFRLDGQDLEVAANSAILLWNAGQITDLEALGRLENCQRDSEVWTRRMEELKALTGHGEYAEAEGKRAYPWNDEQIRSISASRDGEVFAVSGNGEAFIWRIGEPEPAIRFSERLGKDISFATITGSGNYVALQQGRDIHICRTRDGEPVCKVSNVQRFRSLDDCLAGDRLVLERQSGDVLFTVYDLEPLKAREFRADPALLPNGQDSAAMLSDTRYAVQLVTSKLGKCIAAFRGKELGIWETGTGRMLAYYPDDTVLGNGDRTPAFLCLCGEDDEYLACWDGLIRWRDGVRVCSCKEGGHIVSVEREHVRVQKGWTEYCLPFPTGQPIKAFLELSRIRSLKLALADQQRALRLLREARETMDAGAFDEARAPLFAAETLLNDELMKEWIGLYRRLSARARRGGILRYLNLGQLRMDGKIRAAAFRVNSDTLCAWDDHGERKCLSVAAQPIDGPCALLVRTPGHRRWMNEKPSYEMEMIDPSPFFDAPVERLYYCDRWNTSSEENPNTDLVETEGQIVLKAVDLATRRENTVDPGHAYSDTGNTEYSAMGAISADGNRVLLLAEERTGRRTQDFLYERDGVAGEFFDRSQWLEIAPFEDFCCGGARESDWLGGYDIVSSDGDFAARLLDDYTLELRLLIRRCEILPPSDDVSQTGKLPEIFLALHPKWTEVDFEGLLAELRIRGLGHIRSEALRDRLTP